VEEDRVANSGRRLLALWLAAALVLAACGGGGGETDTEAGSGGTEAAGGDAGELNVFLVPSPSSTALQAMIPAFTEETGITVNVTETPYGEAHQQQLLAFRAGNGQYDVVQFDNTFLANYGNNQVLEPLDPYLEGSEAYDVDDFPAPLRDYGDYQGQTLGLILSTEPFLLWYRTDIFSELGLEPPETWDEYLQTARTISESGRAAGQIMGYASPANSWWFNQLLWSFGGQLYDEDFNPTVDTPAGRQAIDFMVESLRYAPDAAVSATGDDVTNVFISEDVGMMIQYSGYYPLVVDPETSSFPDQVATVRVPTGSEDVIHLAGWNIGIPADSQRKDQAWQFLEFALGKDNATTFLEEGAAAIGRTSVTTDDALLSEQPYLAELNIPESVRVERYPQLVTWPEVESTMGTHIADILTGSLSPEEGLAAMQAALEPVLANEPR
jgi:ABC-type glycerol-3-phosphate transport system substrate-binding protein